MAMTGPKLDTVITWNGNEATVPGTHGLAVSGRMTPEDLKAARAKCRALVLKKQLLFDKLPREERELDSRSVGSRRPHAQMSTQPSPAVAASSAHDVA